MTATDLAVGLTGVALLAAFTLWIYRRRELPVPGRGLLAALRLVSLVLLVLLLLDPTIPTVGAGSDGGRWTLIDASRSMAVGPADSPDTPWERAVREIGGAGRVARFGEGEPTTLEGPDPGAPDLDRSVLAPALERIAEAGALRVRVITDLRLEDPDGAAVVARRLGLDLEVVDVGEPVVNASLRSFTVPAGVREGEGPEVEIEVAASAESAGDSATVEILEEGRLVASRRTVLPGVGRSATLSLVLPAPRGPGEAGDVRYTARVTAPGDRFAGDDERIAYTTVDPVEGSLVLVSTEPDWEPRFLIPVLAQATGLPARGYLRVGADRWLVAQVGEAGEGGGTASSADVSQAVSGAELLVVQGGGEGAPAWLREAVTSSRRVLVLASSPDHAAPVGVSVGLPAAGEWYVTPDLPASPVGAELVGVDFSGLPPLRAVLPWRGTDGPDAPVALTVTRGAGGSVQPAVLLRSEEGRRTAVALASGFWRWAFRSDESRTVYRRLWAGVGGWVLAETAASGASVRPADRVVRAGEPVTWLAGPAAGGMLSLTLSRDGAPLLDTTVSVPATGRVRTAALEAGSYTYVAGTGEESAEGSAEGRFDVEGWTADLDLPRAEGFADGLAAPSAERIERGGRRPLRTHPLPYLVILAALSAEWIGRRRRGLR